MKPRILAAALLTLLAACHDNDRAATAPPPQRLSDSAVAQFCGMDLGEHPGPKGQIFLRDDKKPMWFASVRDAVAFTLLPEMPKNVAAIYVSDMSHAADANHADPDAWVDARKAVFVIDSRQRGGMGAAEAVPFADPAAAQRFIAANGGHVVDLAHIPQSYVLGSGGDAS